MKTLSLLLLGAGAVYFVTKKKPSATLKTESESKTIPPGQTESNLMGYKIVNCDLTIYNKQKALDFAFKLGADNSVPDYNEGNTWSTSPLKTKLFSDCIESEVKAKILMKTKEKALFIFELMKFLYSGISSKSISFDDDALSGMQQFKDNIAKVFGYDVSDFKVELVKKL